MKCLILPQYVSWGYLGFAVGVQLGQSVVLLRVFGDGLLTQVDCVCHGQSSKEGEKEEKGK